MKHKCFVGLVVKIEYHKQIFRSERIVQKTECFLIKVYRWIISLEAFLVHDAVLGNKCGGGGGGGLFLESPRKLFMFAVFA